FGMIDQTVRQRTQVMSDLVQVPNLLLLVASTGVRNGTEVHRDGDDARIDRLRPPLVRRQRTDENIAGVKIVVEALLVFQLSEQAKQVDSALCDHGSREVRVVSQGHGQLPT